MMHYIFDLDDCIILHQNKIKYHWISEDKELTYYLKRCKAKKYVYTNGNYSHARVILHKMKIYDIFDIVFTREDTFPYMKPLKKSAQIIEKKIKNLYPYEQEPIQFIFFDDRVANLQMGKIMGWITVWITKSINLKPRYSFIDEAFPTLMDALKHFENINL